MAINTLHTITTLLSIQNLKVRPDLTKELNIITKGPTGHMMDVAVFLNTLYCRF